ncbi:hypothetical protein Poli38472_014359 [Pythium oligandrum]|uniref:Uncharacterized protein n=1 Tax=Pythium oligandrum TaxID=41045 RepID=A0A8K1C6Y9_PYTOL|nr:hypothetical protein Poli38472_014359 [Pythium oligandrum]|eukprot:TMW57756.1 hypothetical protein Poli38472_014359 [Pythium oligandrum]
MESSNQVGRLSTRSMLYQEVVTKPTVRSLRLQHRIGGDTATELFSALRASNCLKSLHVEGILQDKSDADRKLLRQWLTWAIFSRQAAHKIQFVSLSDWWLTFDDVKAVEELLNASDPMLLLNGTPSDNNMTEIPASESKGSHVKGLTLRFGDVETTKADSAATRLLVVLKHLPLVKLSVSVSESPGLSGRALRAAWTGYPALEELTMSCVKLTSNDDDVFALTDCPHGLRTLQLDRLTLATHTNLMRFFKALGDFDANPKAAALEELVLDVSVNGDRYAHSLLNDVKSMLEKNDRLRCCVLRMLPMSSTEATREVVMQRFDGQVIPMLPAARPSRKAVKKRHLFGNGFRCTSLARS